MFLLNNKLMTGDNVTNRSICSVIDKEGNKTNYVWDDELKQLVETEDDMIDENFKKVTVEKQIDNICQILGAEAKHYYCSDRTTKHEKIVIEYNHTKK